MKKCFLALAMVATLGLVANVALTQDDTVYFPFWQDGFGLSTFFSIANTHPDNPVEITINYMDTDGNMVISTTATVEPGDGWFPDTLESWFQDEVPFSEFGYYGFGNIELDWMGETPENAVYLWGCIYVFLTAPYGAMQPGFTLVLPGNPYGA